MQQNIMNSLLSLIHYFSNFQNYKNSSFLLQFLIMFLPLFASKQNKRKETKRKRMKIFLFKLLSHSLSFIPRL